MEHNEQFDELARRKLAGIRPSFEEGHWSAAEQLLKAHRGSSLRRSYWWGGALLLLLAGAVGWWSVPDAPLAQEATAHTKAAPNALDRPQVVNEVGDPEGSHTPAAGIPGQALPSGAEAGAAKGMPTMRSAPSAMISAHRTKAQGIKAGRTSSTAPAPKHDQPATMDPTAIIGQASEVGNTVLTNDAPTLEQDPSNTALTRTMDSPATSTYGGTVLLEVPDPLDDAREVLTGAEDKVRPPTVDDAVATIVPRSPSDAPSAGPRAEHGSASSALEALQTPVALPADSVEQASDPFALPPLVPHGSPWEIGVVAGLQVNRTVYGSDVLGERNAVSDPLRTVAIGLEVMRMGRHFGLGTGLHLGHYDEQLRAGVRYRDQLTLSPFWFLSPVDTTILFITDTVLVDGEPYYNGVPVNVTVQVPTQGADTTISTVQDREARTTINRSSYVEIPLLLDAHLVQGRWSLGLRGGPNLGLLSGRRGSLPDPGTDGYVDLADVAFRKVVFGWTMRAYVRYRFNAGWSLGIEPMLRGQFGSGLQGDAFGRRSSAAGLMVGLTYRFR